MPRLALWTQPWRRPIPAPLIPPLPRSLLVDEVSALGSANRLLRQGPYEILLARAREIPALLLEVGRVRELAFRGVNEGTGKSHDLDRFDEHYEHLILWDQERSAVAGGYRMVRTSEALAHSGSSGLYTATLFRMDSRLFNLLGPALELGRSFVHPDYQRRPHSLLLLWKGIGRYLERHPECRVLFGPVSITGSFPPQARFALTGFLRREVAAGEALRRHVKARRPPRTPWNLSRTAERAQTIEEIDELVRSSGGPTAERGIPVLLRQYLKLGGRVLDCSIDPGFGGCVDALMVVDLRQADRHRLDKMLGTSLSTRMDDLAGHRDFGMRTDRAVGGIEI